MGNTLIKLLSGNGAPSEIRLFAWGENETTKGTFVLDKESSEEILKRFAAYGNDLALDYEHQTYNDHATGPVPAAGWIPQGGLAARDDGLWAKVKWTDEAKRRIEAREYRYFSPSFRTDKQGRIVELEVCALVNFPATIGMDALIAARRDLRVHKLASFNAITSALCSALYKQFGGEAYLCDVFDDAVIFRNDDRMYRIGYQMDGTAAVLVGDPQEVEMSYSPVEGAVSTEEMNQMKLINKALGLNEAADESVALSAVTKMSSAIDKLLSLSGKDSIDQAIGTIAGWKDAAAEADIARVKLAAIEAEKAEGDVQRLLSDAARAGKAGASNADTCKRWLKICGANEQGKGANVQTLSALLETIPTITAPTVAESKQPPVDGAADELTSEERRQMARFGWTKEQWISARNSRRDSDRRAGRKLA